MAKNDSGLVMDDKKLRSKKAYFPLYVASYALKMVYHSFVCMDYCVITLHISRPVWSIYIYIYELTRTCTVYVSEKF